VIPGEIYWAEFMDVGLRPVVVMGREQLNRGSTVLVSPLTSMHVELRSRLPNCVPFSAGEFGLTKDCVAQLEFMSLIPLEKLELQDGPIGELDDDRMRQMIRAIGYVLDAECEPM
jgi:mRNA-degrading endonuclease toxin of MazEF toxin-antitoxin module